MISCPHVEVRGKDAILREIGNKEPSFEVQTVLFL